MNFLLVNSPSSAQPIPIRAVPLILANGEDGQNGQRAVLAADVVYRHVKDCVVLQVIFIQRMQ